MGGNSSKVFSFALKEAWTTFAAILCNPDTDKIEKKILFGLIAALRSLGSCSVEIYRKYERNANQCPVFSILVHAAWLRRIRRSREVAALS